MAHEAGLAHQWTQRLMLRGDRSGPLGSAGEEPEEDRRPFPGAARRLTRNAAGRDERKRSQEALWAEGTRRGRAQIGQLPALMGGRLGLPEGTSLRPRAIPAGPAPRTGRRDARRAAEQTRRQPGNRAGQVPEHLQYL